MEGTTKKRNARARQLASLALARAARHGKGRGAGEDSVLSLAPSALDSVADDCATKPVGSGDDVVFGGGSEDAF